MKTSLSRIMVTSICSNGGRVVVVILKEHRGGVERTSGGANQPICLSYYQASRWLARTLLCTIILLPRCPPPLFVIAASLS
jgi:hypothetical protein